MITLHKLETLENACMKQILFNLYNWEEEIIEMDFVFEKNIFF